MKPEEVRDLLIDSMEKQIPIGEVLKMPGIKGKYTRRQIDYYSVKKWGRSWQEQRNYLIQKSMAKSFGFYEKTKVPKDYRDRLKAGYSIYMVQDDKADIVKVRETEKAVYKQKLGSEPKLFGYQATEPQQLHRYECNIPYAPYNPVKRISLSARAIASAGEWLHPDEPLFKVEKTESPYQDILTGARYHDLTTLNAKIGIATKEEDLRLTVDDAVIISKEFSERAQYDYIYTHTRTGKKIQTAKLLVKDNKPVPLTKRFYYKGMPLQAIRQDGKIVYSEEASVTGTLLPVGEPIEHKTEGTTWYTQHYNMHIKGHIGIGDKLLGLTGLRGVVADIREDLDCDIMVHSSKIWGSKNSRKCGAWVMELRKHDNYSAVFFQPQHIATNEASIRPVSISSTMWSVLHKVRDKKILKSTRFEDILHMIRCEIVEDRIKPINKKTTERKGGRIIKAKINFFDNQKPDNIWIPDWLALEYQLDNRRIKTKLLLEIESTLRADNEDKRQRISYYVSQDIVRAIKSKKMFETIIPKSRYNFVCIPKTHSPDTIEINSGFEEGTNVLIVREPVISNANIQSKRVVIDHSLPKNVARVHTEVMRDMYGDFDGDRIWILPINDKQFEHQIEGKEPSDLYLPLSPPLKLTPPTYEESLKKAEEYHNKVYEEKVYFAGRIGGARKTADLYVNDKTFTEEVTLPNASLLESGIKDRITGDEFKEIVKDFIKTCQEAKKSVNHRTTISVLYNNTWSNIRHLADTVALQTNGLYNDFFI